MWYYQVVLSIIVLNSLCVYGLVQGPAFALIGAWLVDQNQNKEMIKSDEYEDLFQKAIIMSGLGLILSHFGPIDDWYTFNISLFDILCDLAPNLGNLFFSLVH